MRTLNIHGLDVGIYKKRNTIFTDVGDIILTFDKFKPSTNLIEYILDNKNDYTSDDKDTMESMIKIINDNMGNQSLIAEITIKTDFSFILFALYDRIEKKYLLSSVIRFKLSSINFYWEE